MLSGTRRMVKMRNALQPHVIDREFHIPIINKVEKVNTEVDEVSEASIYNGVARYRRSNSAHMKLEQSKKSYVYQKIRKPTVIVTKREKSKVDVGLVGSNP